MHVLRVCILFFFQKIENKKEQKSLSSVISTSERLILTNSSNKCPDLNFCQNSIKRLKKRTIVPRRLINPLKRKKEQKLCALFIFNSFVWPLDTF